MTTAPGIDWSDLKAFFSPVGQQQLAGFIQQAKEQRGAGWLEWMETEYPTFFWLCELACKCDADTAFTEIAKAYPIATLAKPQLIGMHGWLKAEIEKPRF